MSPKKVYQLYPTFEAWVQAHEHSSCTVYYVLKDALEAGAGDPIEALNSYIVGLNELKSEIDAEITETRFWIKYFRNQKRR